MLYSALYNHFRERTLKFWGSPGRRRVDKVGNSVKISNTAKLGNTKRTDINVTITKRRMNMPLAQQDKKKHLAKQINSRAYKTSLTRKGQVTIPKRLREYLRVQPKDQIEFKIEQGRVVIKPTTSLKVNFGKVKSIKRPENFKEIRKDFEKKVGEEIGKEV